MRDLTAEELALAPEWANHYAIDDDGDILFFDDSKNKVQLIDGTDEFSVGDYIYVKRISLQSKVIEKPFDIKKHNWSDVYFDGIDFEGDINLLCLSSSGDFYLSKNDAIAIARHFKLTGDDMK